MTSLLKSRILLLCGHYGTGKTNIAVNLAENTIRSGKKCVIVDLDTVNPYFRTADNAEALKKMGVITLIPEFANTNVDIPALPPALPTIFDRPETVIVDVGGNADGAAVLGGFSERFKEAGYAMYYVFNAFRPENIDTETSVASLRSIEDSSQMRFTGIVNNTNLGVETDAAVLKKGMESSSEFASRCGLPVCLTTAFSAFGLPNVTVIDDITKKLF